MGQISRGLIGLAGLALPSLTAAQSVRVVPKGRDSALVILRANCSTACDSVRYTGKPAETVLTRTLRPGQADTLRVRGGVTRSFPVSWTYETWKHTTTTATVTIPQIMLDTVPEYRINGGAWQQDKHAIVTATDRLETRLAIYNAAKQLVGEVR